MTSFSALLNTISIYISKPLSFKSDSLEMGLKFKKLFCFSEYFLKAWI